MKTIATIIICSVFIIIFHPLKTFSATPKKATISGIIIDQASNKPIEYASLVLINIADTSILNGTISAADGSFMLENIETGSYHLKVHFIGYKTKVIENLEINSKRDKLNLGNIQLNPSSILLEETEIVANNNYIDFKIDKKVINVSEHINAEGGAVVEALNNVPSVQVDGGGNVTLRGSSSFTLLIDGRPSVLEPSDALNQIQSSSVEKIEVITNPSVKYDSDGTTGIINLIMKKQKLNGISGQAMLSLATGDKYAANVLLNRQSNKLNTQVGLTYSNKRKITESTDNRQIFGGDSISYQDISSLRDIYRKNYKLNFGIDYKANPKNDIYMNLEIGQWEFDRNIKNDRSEYNNFNNSIALNNIQESFILNNIYGTGELGYKHNFDDDHQLDLNYYYARLSNETPNDITIKNLNSEGIEIPLATDYLKLFSKSERNHSRFKTDYVLPISASTTFEAGYQNNIQSSATNYTYDYRSEPNTTWLNDSTLSGEMNYRRMENAIYTTLKTSVKSISIQAGIRIEYANRYLHQQTTQKTYERNNFNFFPSLHFSKSLKNDQQISLSYSRRISRPNEWMLLPALHSTGRNMLQIGNPELLPDFTNSYELGYSMRNEIVMLSADLYFRQTENAITPAMLEKGGNFYQTYENLQKELAGGIEMMSNINIRKWWRMNVSTNIYLYKLTGTLNSGYEVDNSSFAWNGFLKTTFIVKKKTFLEFMAVYYGPSILPQGKSQDFYYFDFFVRRNFFNRKLTLALRSHNTFDTGIYVQDTQGNNFKANTWFKYEGPTFMLTLTYRLNNFNRKKSGDQPDMNFDSGLDR